MEVVSLLPLPFMGRGGGVGDEAFLLLFPPLREGGLTTPYTFLEGMWSYHSHYCQGWEGPPFGLPLGLPLGLEGSVASLPFQLQELPG